MYVTFLTFFYLLQEIDSAVWVSLTSIVQYCI